MTVRCPKCQGSLLISEQHFGKKVRCPQCQAAFTVGQPATAQQTLAASKPVTILPDPAGLGVPLGDARSLVARHKQRCRGTWLLDDIPAKDLAKARAGFAAKMAQDETPLVLGKHYKFLVTDRCVYGGGIQQPIPLRMIVTATHSRYDLFKAMANAAGSQTQFFINGRQVMETSMGTMPLGFLEPVLEGLGAAARRQAPAQPGEFTAEDFVRIAAAAVCAGRPTNATASHLSSIGDSQAEATRRLCWMADLFATPNRIPGIVMIVGGMLCFGFCFGAAVWLQTQGLWIRRGLYSAGALGIFAVLAGAYHVIAGKSGLDEKGLADAWVKQEKRKPPVRI